MCVILLIAIARKLWRDYFASGVDGVVFIVDAVDRARFPEAKKELDVSLCLHVSGTYCTSATPPTSVKVFICLIVCFFFSSGNMQALLLSDELANVPFLVLGNKIDLGSAPSEEDLRYQLGLYETYGKEPRAERNPSIRPVELYMCSVVRKMGYGDGKLQQCCISYWFVLNLCRTFSCGPIVIHCSSVLFVKCAGFKWLAQFL